MYNKTQIRVFLNRYRQLRKVIAGLPEHEQQNHIRMWNWAMDTDCGTVRCVAGYAGVSPWFRKQGFKLAGFTPIYIPRNGAPTEYGWSAVEAFFGIEHSQGNLHSEHPVFSAFAYAQNDDNHGDPVPASTVLRRIDHEIAWLEQMRIDKDIPSPFL